MDEPPIPHTVVGLVFQGNAVTGTGLCSVMERVFFCTLQKVHREGDGSFCVPAWEEQQNPT